MSTRRTDKRKHYTPSGPSSRPSNTFVNNYDPSRDSGDNHFKPSGGQQDHHDLSITQTTTAPRNRKGPASQNENKDVFEGKRVVADKGYFDKLKAHCEVKIKKNLYVGQRIFTAPYDERLQIGQDCPHLQAALNSVAGQHAQAKLIVLPPGVHKGPFRFDRSASTVSIEGFTLGLRVMGDSRNLSGLTYIHGIPCVHTFNDLGSGLVELNLLDSNYLQIKATGLDLVKSGLGKDDKIIIRDTQGNLSERNVILVETNTIKFDGVPLTGITSVTFCPNVVLTIDEKSQDPLFVVANASLTFRGIRFTATSPKTQRSLIIILGNSVVNAVGCIFDDIDRKIETPVIVSMGSLLLGCEVDEYEKYLEKETDARSTKYPITIIGGIANNLKVSTGAAIGESCLTLIGSSGNGCLLKPGSTCVPTHLIVFGNKIGVKSLHGSSLCPAGEAIFTNNGISIVAEVGAIVSMPKSSFAFNDMKTHTNSGPVNATFENQFVKSESPVALTLDPGSVYSGISIYMGKSYSVYSLDKATKHTITLPYTTKFIGAGSGNIATLEGTKVGEGLQFTIVDPNTVLVTSVQGVTFA